MADIVGKWQITVGVLSGFTYEFQKDGTFYGEFPAYNVKFSGTYKTDDSQTPHFIDLEVTEHNQGDVGKGTVKGIYEVEDDMLKMKLNEPGKERWTDPTAYVYYQKVD
jgi:uncharacterized protein (TIGR03067 family)